jgi:hypothetical protein
MISERRIKKNVEGSGRGQILRDYTGLEGMRKTTKVSVMTASPQPEI